MTVTKKKKPAAKGKPMAKAKPAARAKKGEAFECGVCGYRIVIDEACGCKGKHVLVCCGKPMKRKPAKNAAKKK